MMAEALLWLMAGAGMVAHWAKRYAMDQTQAPIRVYFLVNDRGHSIAAAITCLVATATYLSAWDGQLTTATVYSVFLTGYAADSAANKG